MINLIPNEEKKLMVRDFYIRLIVVTIFVLAFSVLFAALTLVPAYFMSSLHKDFTQQKLDTQKLEPEPVVNPATSEIIKVLDTKLSMIEKSEKQNYALSGRIVNEIILKKMSDIKINDIAYKYDPLVGEVVTVSGIAPSRERLLLFRQVLEEDVNFKKVDLPISNFIKGSDISFSLNLIPS